MKLSICTGGDKRLEEQRQRASVFLSQLEQRKAEMGKESRELLVGFDRPSLEGNARLVSVWPKLFTVSAPLLLRQ